MRGRSSKAWVRGLLGGLGWGGAACGSSGDGSGETAAGSSVQSEETRRTTASSSRGPETDPLLDSGSEGGASSREASSASRTPETCEVRPCLPGQVGCACGSDPSCDQGTCIQGRCALIRQDAVLVPEGPFCMGCPPGQEEECSLDELPRHEVWLPTFAIDRQEVSQGQYQACVDAGVCPPPAGPHGDCRPEWQPPLAPDRPVVCVPWDWAWTYCRWAGKRLPTEAEWEKAARGPESHLYPWGSEEPSCDRVNFAASPAEPCLDQPAATDSHPRGSSPYGAVNLAGNVGEWVWDWYAPDYYAWSPTHEPEGPDQGTARVVRGGSYQSSARLLRGSSRSGWVAPFVSTDTLGFRCAADPK